MTELTADSHLDDLIQELKEVRDEKSELADNMKKINARKEYLESLIIERLRSEGVKKVSSEFGTASLKTESYPNMDDFNAFIESVMESKAWELLPKKVNSAAWREALREGNDVPGVSSFTKTTLNFRRKG